MKFCLKGICLLFCLSAIIADVLGQQQTNVYINFHNRVGDKHIVLEETTYTNAFNETFTINRFRYYISQIVLTDILGKQFQFPEQYFLIDTEDTASTTIILKGSFQKLKSIQFVVGVDSVKNVTGVHTGVLDPMQGMYWTWNTGYVFAKLEGFSKSSTASSNYYSYHVGGYKQNENALRTVTLQLPQNSDTNTINISADALRFFKSVHDIKISQSPVCHQAGELAMRIADNYATMFSIINP